MVSMGSTSFAIMRMTLVVELDLAFDDDHRAGFEHRRALAECLRENHDLDASMRIFEHDDRHAIALARFQLAGSTR